MKKNIIILIVAIGFFMEGLDATALNTALPQIAFGFGINPIYLKVVLTSYFLSVGIFISASGWFADRYGIKPIYACAILTFLIGSIGCGLSVTIPMLIIFRIVQGIGGAFLTPVGRIIILRVYGTKNFADAVSLIAIVLGFGMILGPLLGGGLTTWLNWRWIFFINIPFALFGLIAMYRVIPPFAKPHDLPPFDWLGFICIGLGLGFLLLFFDVLVEPIAPISVKILVAAIGFMFFIAYKLHSAKTTNPLISHQLFHNKKFIFLTTGSIVIRLALAVPPFLIPLLLQVDYKYSAFEAGMLMVPAAIGLMVAKPLAKPLIAYVDFLTLVYSGVIFNSLVLLGLSFVSIHFSYVFLVILLFAYGAGVSIQTTVMNVAIYQSVPESLYTQAVPYNSAGIQLSASFAIATAALIIILQLSSGDLYHAIPISAFKHVFQIECLFPLLSLFFFRAALRNN